MEGFVWGGVVFIMILVASAYDEARKARKNGDLIIEEIEYLKERIVAIEDILMGRTDNHEALG